MLARTFGPRFSSYPCYLQPKLNGVRGLQQNSIFQSRGEKFWKPAFVQHIIDELLHIRLPADCILDGEFYVHGWRLQRINSAMGVNTNEPNSDTPNIEFHVFDRVMLNTPFAARWIEISSLITLADMSHVKAVPTHHIISSAEADNHFHSYTALGYEGVMLRPNGPYEFGEHLSPRTHGMTEFRSKNLWKRKQWQDGEFLCIGVEEGQGKREGMAGALLLEGGGKVGTGWDDDEGRELLRNPPIGRLIRVRYLELTADGIPFNPSFIAVM